MNGVMVRQTDGKTDGKVNNNNQYVYINNMNKLFSIGIQVPCKKPTVKWKY